MKVSQYLKIIFVSTTILLLYACESSSPYKPAQSARSIGYQERQISDDRWRISFRIGNDDIAAAQDYALLRAAELTLEKGFDWFEVIDRNTDSQKSNKGGVSFGIGVGSSSSRRCGLFGCSGVGVSAGVGNSNDRQRSITTLEIRFGKGVRPEAANFYDARSTGNTLRNSLIKEND